MTYDLGDRVPLRYRALDADQQLVDTTMALAVTAPDGTITAPTVTRTSLGIYDDSVPATQVGQWRATWTASGTIVDEVTVYFDVADPAPPLYCSLDRFKRALGVDLNDASRDDELFDRLDAASRGIERNTHRKQFWLAPVPAVRTYRVADRVSRSDDGFVFDFGDDIGSLDGLVVEIGSNTSGWTAVTDYETGPENALEDGLPIVYLIRPSSWGTQRVRITARPGWPAIPVVLEEATQLQASRLNKRKDSPQGIVGSSDWGAVRLGRVDPDVEELVKTLQRLG